MVLKVGFAQAAAPTTPGNVDFTDANAGFVSDVKAAVFFATSAVANNTSTAHLRFGVGINANNSGTTQAALAIYAQDAKVLGTTATGLNNRAAAGFGLCTTGAYISEAVVSSWLATGARLNFTTAATAYLVNALLIGGDVEAKVSHATFANGTPSNLAIAHGLAGVPEVLLLITGYQDAVTGQSAQLGFAFYDVATATLSGVHFATTTGVTPTAANGSISASDINYGFAGRSYSVTSVDATNVNIQSSTSSDGREMYVLALRGTSSPLVAKTGFFTTETAISAVQEIAGMSASPKAVLLWGTKFTSVPQSVSTDVGATHCFGAAITNSGGTKQGVASFSEDDNVTTTVSKSQTSNTQVLRIIDVAGVADVEATLSAWNADGASLSYSNINATPFEVGYLAIGETPPRGGINSIDGGLKNLTGGMRG